MAGSSEAPYVRSESDARTVNNAMRHQYRVLSEAEKAAIEEPPQTDTNASGNSLSDRLDGLFNSQIELIERVARLEERVNAPPIGIGRRP